MVVRVSGVLTVLYEVYFTYEMTPWFETFYSFFRNKIFFYLINTVAFS